MSTRRDRRLLAGVAAAVVGSVLTAGTVSWATFTSTTAASAKAGTASLPAPTGLTATCPVPTQPINLSWTASASPAGGYAILRSTTSGSGFVQITTVSGRTTTTYNDTVPSHVQQYWYVVQATDASWNSANSAQATTGNVC